MQARRDFRSLVVSPGRDLCLDNIVMGARRRGKVGYGATHEEGTDAHYHGHFFFICYFHEHILFFKGPFFFFTGTFLVFFHVRKKTWGEKR